MQRFRRAASAMALVSLSRSAFLLVRHSATLRFGAGTFRLDLAGSNGCCSGSPPLAAARDAGGTHLRPWRPPHRRARAPHAACPARANTEGSDRPRMASPLAERERKRPARRYQSRLRPLTPQAGRRRRGRQCPAPQSAVGAGQHPGRCDLRRRQALRHRRRDRYLEPAGTGAGCTDQPGRGDRGAAAALHPGVGRAGGGAHRRG